MGARNHRHKNLHIAFKEVLVIILLSIGLIVGGCKSNNDKRATTDKAEAKNVAAKKPIIVEIVEAKGTKLNKDTLMEIVRQDPLSNLELYKWKNRYIVFGNITEPENLTNKIVQSYPYSEVKVYKDMCYEFDRSKHCENSTLAKKWDNILLTANLVKDSVLQKEYLDYHATQFEKWPEVANGFCNANFQQLLVYRSGRQLMLVISVPTGESLDSLNPKTTENNPRVDQWNALMKKYQEGIEGAKPGETWVFFEKL